VPPPIAAHMRPLLAAHIAGYALPDAPWVMPGMVHICGFGFEGRTWRRGACSTSDISAEARSQAITTRLRLKKLLLRFLAVAC
jgi:hypothetical protein